MVPNNTFFVHENGDEFSSLNSPDKDTLMPRIASNMVTFFVTPFIKVYGPCLPI